MNYHHLLVPVLNVTTFQFLIIFLQSLVALPTINRNVPNRYLSEAVNSKSIPLSNTYSVQHSGTAVVPREALLANQNLSKWSISDMEGKSSEESSNCWE